MAKVAIALGGNIGQVEETFNKAIIMLMKEGLNKIRISSILINPPVGCVKGTPNFKNAALIGEWENTAQELLELCQKIEQTLGRPKNHKSNISRTIDLDIIIFGEEIINKPNIQIPHPRAKEREFVLLPLSQVAPQWIFPDTKINVSATLKKLKSHNETM